MRATGRGSISYLLLALIKDGLYLSYEALGTHGCPPDEVRGRLYEDIIMGLYEGNYYNGLI